jgi:hypothetical protein
VWSCWHGHEQVLHAGLQGASGGYRYLLLLELARLERLAASATSVFAKVASSDADAGADVAAVAANVLTAERNTFMGGS